MPLPALFLKPYLRIWKIVVPLPTQKAFYLQGEMAEWSIAAVLKTVEGHTSGGSNPSLSAVLKKSNARNPEIIGFSGFFIFLALILYADF